jgi:hypothetical protein
MAAQWAQPPSEMQEMCRISDLFQKYGCSGSLDKSQFTSLFQTLGFDGESNEIFQGLLKQSEDPSGKVNVTNVLDVIFEHTGSRTAFAASAGSSIDLSSISTDHLQAELDRRVGGARRTRAESGQSPDSRRTRAESGHSPDSKGSSGHRSKPKTSSFHTEPSENAGLPATISDMIEHHSIRSDLATLPSTTPEKHIVSISRAPAAIAQADPDAPKLLLISDPGQDLDDEMTFIMLRHLVDTGQVDVLGIVTTLAPSFDRARLCRGTLDTLGLFDVPVGIGTDGGDIHGMYKAENFETWASSYMPSRFSESSSSLEPGRRLMHRLYQAADERSITLVIIASLKDAAVFMRDNETLFVEKTREVVIMGGVEPWEQKEGEEVLLRPDSAHNNQFDDVASEFFYRRCQELGVRLIICSRWAAYAAKVPRQIYDEMASLGSSIGCRMRNAQRSSIEGLWARACAPSGSTQRAGLPDRCDRAWFVKTFCAGKDATDRSGNDTIWDLVGGFMQYDTIATLIALPKMRQLFFRPTSVRGLRGVEHLVIGRTENDDGVHDPEKLLSFLHRGFQEGLSLNHRNSHQCIFLIQPLWNTLSDNMIAAIIMRALHSIGMLECIGIVLSPDPQAREVAAQEDEGTQMKALEETGDKLKEILKAVGLAHVPVFVGSDYRGDDTAEHIHNLYSHVSPAGVTLVIGSSLCDANNFAEQHPKLFQERTRGVVLIGGVLEVDAKDVKADSANAKIPDSSGKRLIADPLASNNRLDIKAAEAFIARAQDLLVPLTVISRHCAAAVSLPYEIFDVLGSHGGAVGALVRDTQDHAMQIFWEATASKDRRTSLQSCPEEEMMTRRKSLLPERCDREWFVKNFCDGQAVDMTSDECPAIKRFMVYSPLALLTTLSEVFDHLTECTTVTVRSTAHRLVGISEEKSGVRDTHKLQTLIMQLLVKGTRLNASEFDLTSPPPIPVGDQMWLYDEREEALEWLLPEDLRVDKQPSLLKFATVMSSRHLGHKGKKGARPSVDATAFLPILEN